MGDSVPKFLQVIREVVTLHVGFHGVLTGEGLFGVSFVPRGECREKFVLLGWFHVVNRAGGPMGYEE